MRGERLVFEMNPRLRWPKWIPAGNKGHDGVTSTT
jgi:hypothetical protein